MVHAAFAVVIFPSGKIAGVTRQPNGFGLPGGKLETGEDSYQAAIRESSEEGWDVGGRYRYIHIDKVEGKDVVWILFENAKKRVEWKEKGRIEPVELTLQELASTGLGNNEVAKRIRYAVSLLPLMKAVTETNFSDFDYLDSAFKTYKEPRLDQDYKDAAASLYYDLYEAMKMFAIDIYKKVPHGGDCPRAFLDWVKDARTKFKQ
jgi:hypothetical protein